jgi:hypothetical protein
MSEFKCNVCNRIMKSKAGLAIHSKSCVVETKEVEVVEDEVVCTNEPSDNIKRKIAKLRDSYLSTQDAQSRYDIQCRIAELEKL